MANQKQKSEPKNKLIKTAIFFAAVVVMVGGLLFLSLTPKPRPLIPDDEAHRPISDWKDCKTCHCNDCELPFSPEHPLKLEDCMRCHQRENAPKR